MYQAEDKGPPEMETLVASSHSFPLCFFLLSMNLNHIAML